MLKRVTTAVIALVALLGIVGSVVASAQEPTAEPKFRQGPVVSLRPIQSTITSQQDGLVELVFTNPNTNDVTLSVDMFVNVPPGISIISEGFAQSSAAGQIHGFFEAPPGTSRTINIGIKGLEIGEYLINFQGSYWPGDNKDAFQPLSLTRTITVEGISPTPPPPTPINATQGPVPTAEPAVANTGEANQQTVVTVDDESLIESLATNPLAYVVVVLLGVMLIVWFGKTVISVD